LYSEEVHALNSSPIISYYGDRTKDYDMRGHDGTVKQFLYTWKHVFGPLTHKELKQTGLTLNGVTFTIPYIKAAGNAS
jgi:hypothetical protein